MSLIQRLGLFMLVAPQALYAASAVIDANQIHCDEAQKKIERAGVLNLSTINAYIYERFVSDARFCNRREYLEPAFIATADSPQCLVGYRCLPSERN